MHHASREEFGNDCSRLFAERDSNAGNDGNRRSADQSECLGSIRAGDTRSEGRSEVLTAGLDVVDLFEGLAKERDVPILMVTDDNRLRSIKDRIAEMETVG